MDSTRSSPAESTPVDLSQAVRKVDVTRRALLALPLILSPALASALAVASGAGGKVSATRVWPANEYTRVTFESAAAFQYQQFFLKDPERLVIDIENAELTPALTELAAKIGADDPYIRTVRVGINRPRVVRVVLDLKVEVKPQVFAVPPAGEFGHRLMLDIYPAKPVDPMLALLDNDLAGFGKGRGETQFDATAPSAAVEIAKEEPAPPATAAAKKTDAPVGAAKKPEAPYIARAPRAIVVMFDPGHGGEDPGAIGRRGTREKDVVLVMARKLREKLHDDGRFRVGLTRDADYFVPLQQRVARARKLRADLFVSVHADAFIQRQANGSSVFALSESGATSTAAKWLANKENDADLIGGVNLNARDSVLARTLLDLSQTAQINDSLKVGKLVLSELGGINRLHKSHVEQAGFAVLKAPDIPSILIETAFISNPDEEKKLRDTAYQDKMADAIADGIRGYFKKNPALARAG